MVVFLSKLTNISFEFTFSSCLRPSFNCCFRQLHARSDLGCCPSNKQKTHLPHCAKMCVYFYAYLYIGCLRACPYQGYGTITTATGLAKTEDDSSYANPESKTTCSKPATPIDVAKVESAIPDEAHIDPAHPPWPSVGGSAISLSDAPHASVTGRSRSFRRPSECILEINRLLHLQFPRRLLTHSYNLPGLMFGPKSLMKINMIMTNLSVSLCCALYLCLCLCVCFSVFWSVRVCQAYQRPHTYLVRMFHWRGPSGLLSAFMKMTKSR